MMPLERTGAFTFVCVAASLIVGLLIALLYKVEDETAGQQALATWKAQIVALLERNKRYPERAQARREHGVVQVVFSLDRNGRVIESAVQRSSGSSLLDEEALALLLRAEPFPAPPREVPGEQVKFTVPIRFLYLKSESARQRRSRLTMSYQPDGSAKAATWGTRAEVLGSIAFERRSWKIPARRNWRAYSGVTRVQAARRS